MRFLLTEEAVNLLKSDQLKGSSASQIAAKLIGATRNAVIGKIQRLGIQRHRPAKARPLPRFRPPPEHPAVTLAPAAVEAQPKPIPLLQLEFHHCRWPLGEEPRTMLFCGATRREGSSYCDAHFRQSYRPR